MDPTAFRSIFRGDLFAGQVCLITGGGTGIGQLAQRARQAPAGRFGTESEVAAAVTFLLGPAAAFITGETLHVAGGAGLTAGYMAPQAPKGALAAFDSFQFARGAHADRNSGQ